MVIVMENRPKVVTNLFASQEPSDYDSDADGHLPPSKPVPASHWVRGALVRETMEVVDQMAKDGQIVKETHVGGKAKMSFIAPVRWLFFLLLIDRHLATRTTELEK